MRGKFITFEGVDGAGKSTHVEWFANELSRVMATVSESDGAANLRKLEGQFAKLAQRKGGKFTPRDLTQARHDKYSTVDEARAAMDTVVAGGRWHWVDDGKALAPKASAEGPPVDPNTSPPSDKAAA